uniref:Uncharacterized protein n=1 Tax=Oryza brachyantha TaxID=4533 RepID=J3LAV5_ORYBR
GAAAPTPVARRCSARRRALAGGRHRLLVQITGRRPTYSNSPPRSVSVSVSLPGVLGVASVPGRHAWEWSLAKFPTHKLATYLQIYLITVRV